MTPPRQTSTPLRIRGLSKRFGATPALDDVSMTVEPGSIHALIGLNGSGKSTLVKVLAGFHHADEGDVSMGEVAFVHQDLGLLPPLSVLENFSIGRPMPMRRGQIDRKVELQRAVTALREFGLEGAVQRPMGALPQAEQAIVAIARALDRSASDAVSTLVLDEPTSALPAHEIDLLADAMRAFAARGVGIVFITHRLQEVVDLADSLTVLRNGRVVFSGRTAETDIPGMVGLMVGDAPQTAATEWVPTKAPGAPVLVGRDLRTETLDGLSFELRRGEIVGVFGMTGSGLESLSEVLAGRAAPTAGEVVYDGKRLSVGSARAREIGYVPSDRPRRGVLPGLSVRENISMRSLGRVVRGGRISGRAERALARHWATELKIKPSNPDAPILTLSGGNQQKAVLGRWLAIEPQVIVAEEPTQGVDVWAKAEILRRLRLAAEGGSGVLLTAVEPEEILDFCDRVVVLRGGRTSLDAPRNSTSITDILSAMH